MESDSDDNSYKTEILEDLIEDPLELQYERVKTKTEMDEQDLPVSEQVEVDTETNDEQCEKLQESRVRASHQQFCALLELMERYGDLAKPYPGVQGRVRSELLWKKLATILNSIDGGVTKTVEKWKRVWADWKCKTKKKAEKIHVDASAGDKLTLTTYENRVLEVMCRAVVGPPYKEDELYNFQISQSTQPSTPSPEDHIDFELLSENDSPRLQTEDIKSKIEVVEHEVVEPRTNYEQVEVKTEPMGEQCEHTQQDSPRIQNANIKIKIEVVEHGPRTNGEQVEVKTEPTDEQNQQGGPNLLAYSGQNNTDINNSSEQQMTGETQGAHLEPRQEKPENFNGKGGICPICNKYITRIKNMKLHMRTHTGERPYVCETCNSSFSKASILQIHIRTHTGEKPYKWYVCNGRFSVKSALRRHNKIHTGEKPFKCDVCNSRFSVKSHLQRHTKIHTGEKPFVCNVCFKGFTRNAVLNRHLILHC